MSKFLHDAADARAMTIPRRFRLFSKTFSSKTVELTTTIPFGWVMTESPFRRLQPAMIRFSLHIHGFDLIQSSMPIDLIPWLDKYYMQFNTIFGIPYEPFC